MKMEWVIATMTIVAGGVTIIWFIRDVRKENSKVFKYLAQIQEKALEIQQEGLEIQQKQSEILAKIEQGQRKGFAAMEQGMERITEGVDKY